MECANCYVLDSPQWRKIKTVIYACCVHYKRWNKHKNVEELYAKILIDMKNNKIIN